MPSIDAVIEEKIGEVRTDSFDITFGELISLYESKEFDIRPEFQRLFRWETEQRSRLVESVLLELPIPQIFMIETPDGVLELIDGLQRISSIIQFIDASLLEHLELKPLRLEGCELVPELNGMLFAKLPVQLRMRVKRAKVRAVVIKRQSTKMLRFEMFKRLNTGGAALSEQEVRNCTARMVGDEGATFYKFLMQCANDANFKNTISTLPEEKVEKRGDEELVLRFFALKNATELFKGSVVDWLDGYMEAVILGKRDFDYETEQRDFELLFRTLNFIMEDGAFVRYRGKNPVGGLAPAYFEAVTLGMWHVLKKVKKIPPERIRETLIKTLQSDEFRDNVGSGSNSLQKFNGRVSSVEEALLGLL